MCGGEVGRRAGGDHGDTARGAETCPGPNRSPGGGVEERPGVAGEAAPLSGAWVRSARQQAREEESPQRGAQGLSRDAGARSLRAASRPRPAAMLALVALAGLWLEVAAGEDDTYLLTRAGRLVNARVTGHADAEANCPR
ncbi:hypothetical protein T484DRAFT_1818271 [Baffinella frigidus]|nr:hypothetical protein T484DRAFT_1818271 [Cryptophyta sp. CCMP2293]